jgi:hypothetical protein
MRRVQDSSTAKVGESRVCEQEQEREYSRSFSRELDKRWSYRWPGCRVLHKKKVREQATKRTKTLDNFFVTV